MFSRVNTSSTDDRDPGRDRAGAGCAFALPMEKIRSKTPTSIHAPLTKPPQAGLRTTASNKSAQSGASSDTDAFDSEGVQPNFTQGNSALAFRFPWELNDKEARVLDLAEGQLDVITESLPHHLDALDLNQVEVRNGNLGTGVLGTFRGNTISVDGDQIADYASRHGISERAVVKTVVMDELAGMQLAQDRNFRTPQNREALAAVAAVLIAGTDNTNLGEQVRQRVRNAGVGSVQAELELNRDNALFSGTNGFYDRVNRFLSSVGQ